MLIAIYILSLISIPAVSESVGLLAFGAGLFGIAITLRRFVRNDKNEGEK